MSYLSLEFGEKINRCYYYEMKKDLEKKLYVKYFISIKLFQMTSQLIISND